MKHLILAALVAVFSLVFVSCAESTETGTGESATQGSLNNQGTVGSTEGSATGGGNITGTHIDDADSGTTSGTTSADTAASSKTGTESPTTGTKGTSGTGMGSADPTYGGETGTTSGTASPNQPKKKQRAKQKTEKKQDTGSVTSSEAASAVAKAREEEQLKESKPVSAQREPSISVSPQHDPEGTISFASEPLEPAPIDWKKDNPARADDGLMSLEPYSRQPQHVGSVQVTGKDKSVAVLEDSNVFTDPNALVRNESSRLATQPVQDLDLNRFAHDDRGEMQSAMTARLGNLEQRFDVLRAQARAGEGSPRTDVLSQITTLEGQHSALEQRVDYMDTIGEEQWSGFVGQFRQSLSSLETQMAQLAVALR